MLRGKKTVLRDQFLLDPDMVFLNHGSYGACPKPVFAVYQEWQRELERQPVEFLGRRSDALLEDARAHLADYVGVATADLVFVPNATSGLNVVARSFPLQAGDEILTTNHEYGALDLTWEHVCGRADARYIHHPIPLPVASGEEVVDAFWASVTPRTRAIFLSHITSPTALIFPVGEICRRARAAGIMTVVDGAHAPGQIPLDLTALGADVYAGNCHKWLSAPKGSGFLYVRPEHQSWVESMIVSWGWVEGHTFVTRNQWQGTRDLAAFLSVPAAIDFEQRHDWDAVRARCHALALDARGRLADLTGLPPIASDPDDGPGAPPWRWFAQMVSLPLPPCDAVDLKRRLYDEHRVEVPIMDWGGRQLVRVSVQGYNTGEDIDRLLAALRQLLPVAAPR